ncbi:starvation-induced peptide utilization protein [Methylocystis parvus]|uniref:starvation-induced peptide utilization protein n=1 Tax=Methylocystis parvus TaxID=134 RepID=UPI003C736633
MALTLCSVVLFRMKRERYAFVAIIPTTWLYICTMTAGLEKIFHDDPKIGFLAHARKFAAALDKGQLLAPAKTVEEMHRVIFNDYVDASLCAIYIVLVLSILGFAIKSIRAARASDAVTTRESEDELLPAGA